VVERYLLNERWNTGWGLRNLRTACLFLLCHSDLFCLKILPSIKTKEKLVGVQSEDVYSPSWKNTHWIEFGGFLISWRCLGTDDGIWE